MEYITLFGLFAVLLLIGVPVALAMGVTSIVVAVEIGIPLTTLVERMVSGVAVFPLLAIPFFILAGEMMNEGGISEKLVALSDALVGRFRGGLAMTNIGASMFFGGISGSALADASSIGSLLIPIMRKKGYHKDYSVAVTVCGATQGIIIPPSQNMIIYSLAAGQVSISALFLAGIIPGVFLGVTMMITAFIIAVKRNYPKESAASWGQACRAVIKAVPGLITGVIIIGGVIFAYSDEIGHPFR